METDRLDCSWCGSARSIEYGICQVCLMEYPLETRVIPLPRPSWDAKGKPVHKLKLHDATRDDARAGAAES